LVKHKLFKLMFFALVDFSSVFDLNYFHPFITA